MLRLYMHPVSCVVMSLVNMRSRAPSMHFCTVLLLHSAAAAVCPVILLCNATVTHI